MRKSVVFRTIFFAALCCALLLCVPALSQTRQLIVNVKKPGAAIPSHFIGFNLSDINCSFDGGLYAELIKNGSFEFDFAWMGWTPFGNVKIETTKPCFDQNPHYAHLTFGGENIGCGIENEGYSGIPLKRGESYLFSCYARTYGVCTMKLRVELVAPDNTVIASKELDLSGKTWVKYLTTITSPTTLPNARIRLSNLLRGAIDVEQVSLFPVVTFRNKNRGLRADLAEAIAEAKPQLLRFPGGNPIDRKNTINYYPWKKSVGRSGNRPVMLNRWSYALTDRLMPDYYQTFGFGLYEFLCFCEETGAEPVLQIGCGLQVLNDKKVTKKQSPEELLDEYKTDALDLIEFVNGDESTEWGSKRAAMGHPQPFGAKTITIADNPRTESDFDYLSSFVEALKDYYPKLTLCGSAGVNPDAGELDLRIDLLKNCKLLTIDEQIFRTPEWMLANAARYDSYKRGETKVVIGEFAAIPDNRQNSFQQALSEAAFLTGVERNADVVKYCAYAPLLARRNAWQCAPDLIWFDEFSVVKTAAYYVQKLFAQNTGTHLLNATWRGKPLTGQDGLYASAVLDKRKNQLVLKVVNASAQEQSLSIVLDSARGPFVSGVSHTLLVSNNPAADNIFDAPGLIAPVDEVLPLKTDRLNVVLPPQSFHLFKVNL